MHRIEIVLTPRRRSLLALSIVSLLSGAIAMRVPVATGAERVGEPCCGVLSVDRARGLVTAYELATGNVFTFTMKPGALASVKPCQRFEADVSKVQSGQAFHANLGVAARVRVDPATPCCEMKGAPGTAGQVAIQPHARFEEVDIILLDIKRDAGETATATCLYCNNGAKVVDLAADLRARGREAKLLDAANRVDHRVVRTGGNSGDAMVSNHGPGLKLAAGQSARTWMKFTAPASNVATLVVPGASAPFENVRVNP